MIADVVQFSLVEGGAWHTWPFRPEIKPSNSELLTCRVGAKSKLWSSVRDGVAIRFHALRLSDGSEWDSVSGFRRPEWNRAH